MVTIANKIPRLQHQNKKEQVMSKEKMSAWRSMLNKDAEDARVMREMHATRTPDPVLDNADMEGTGYQWRNAPAAVPGAAEDVALAMCALWQSERRINLNGKWYVPISEVADILTTPPEEPLSEEWQAKTFPNLNIGDTGMEKRHHDMDNNIEE